MKKINLKGISEILSEKELKNVMGGSGACGSSCSGTCGTVSVWDPVNKRNEIVPLYCQWLDVYCACG